MANLHLPPEWSISENNVTSERHYFTRRSVLKGMLGLTASIAAVGLTGCEQSSEDAAFKQSINLPKIPNYQINPNFSTVDRAITDQDLASSYNNFYEFGGTKNIWLKAQNIPLENWKVEVGGLVKNPRTYDLDDLKKEFPLEERIYRFRCVEAWSMALPWLGFPMAKLMAAVEPTSKAKFVKFTSYYDSEVTTGPLHFGQLPWPYTEGLTIEEMANELAFFAIGIYGRELPKQHGAPLRMVMPWKYGFKGAKSIVKIEFVETQPSTYWNTINGYEYKFVANVDPSTPHPRWSQAQEKFISSGPDLKWEMKETLPFNGYGDYVANLYS